MASGFGQDIEMSTATPETDYISVLNDNVRKAKELIKNRFVRFHAELNKREITILQNIDQIYKENLKQIQSLGDIRSQSLTMKSMLSKQPHPLQVGPTCSQLEESIGQIEQKLSTLSSVEGNWDLDRIEDSLKTAVTENQHLTPNIATESIPQLQITCNLKKGQSSELGELSGQIGDMEVDQETGHIYIADKGNNCIQVYKKDGEFLHAISHHLLVSPNSICLSPAFLYSCNYKREFCNHNKDTQQPGYRHWLCTFTNQCLIKFSKADFQVISFILIDASFGLISVSYPSNNFILYRVGYDKRFEFGSPHVSLKPKETALTHSLVCYNDIFQITINTPLTFQVSTDKYCLNSTPSHIQVIGMQAFENEVHFLMESVIQSFNLQGKLLREITLNVIMGFYSQSCTLSSMCWDGQTNGRLILTDTPSNNIVIISQLGRFYKQIQTENSMNLAIKPIVIVSSGTQSCFILCDDRDALVLQELRLI